MEEILQQLIDKNQIKLIKYNDEFTTLNHKISFCREHKFDVEAELLFQKRIAIKDVISDYNDAIDSLQQILNNWNS